MIEKSSSKVTVLGAGLVGSILAIYLSRKGHTVHVFERRPDMREANVDRGRSINLAMSDRGWKALEELGIDAEIKEIALPMYGRMIHNIDGNTKYQAYGKEGQAIYSVSRKIFNEKLVTIAENEQNIQFHFNEKCWDVNLNNAIANFENTVTGSRLNVQSDVIFGSDGAFSTARNAMMKTERYNYAQNYLEHGYKELTIPANANGKHQLEINALHIWPRGKFMLIALPNTDGTFTCTLFLPYKGENSFEEISKEGKLIPFFQAYFPDALAIMPNLKKEYFKNPTSSLVTISCSPWCYEDKVALIGDAAHCMVPFYGQGMNCGFEDVRILGEIIDQNDKNDWLNILGQYENSRRPNTDAICELARLNFIEMRDLVADEMFLLRKKIENLIHEQYPERWTPLYTLVTFSHTPYAEALEMGLKQDAIMKKIMDIEGIESNWQNIDYGKYI